MLGHEQRHIHDAPMSQGEHLILNTLRVLVDLVRILLKETERMNATVPTVLDKVQQLIAIDTIENATLGTVVVTLTTVQAQLAAAIAANDPAALQSVQDQLDVAISSARKAVTDAGGSIPGEEPPADGGSDTDPPVDTTGAGETDPNAGGSGSTGGTDAPST